MVGAVPIHDRRTDTAGDVPGRVYAGRSGAQRRADRRSRLVYAGFALFGTDGWQATSIERLCAAASVATRSFYEEFSSREALVQEVYDAVVRGLTQAVLDATTRAGRSLPDRISAGIGAYVQHLTEDPRRLRVIYREVRAAPGLQTYRHEAMVAFAAVLEADLDVHVLPADPGRRRALTLALAGAMGEVLVDWLGQPTPRPPTEPLRDELVRLFSVALVERGPADPQDA